MSNQMVWYSRGAGEYRYECGVHHGFDLGDEYDQPEAAQYCAADFYDNHDGWECSWPLNITIYASKDGPAIATFSVELEHEPVFNASVVQAEEAS